MCPSKDKKLNVDMDLSAPVTTTGAVAPNIPRKLCKMKGGSLRKGKIWSSLRARGREHGILNKNEAFGEKRTIVWDSRGMSMTKECN
jgi:hypothetical protein